VAIITLTTDFGSGGHYVAAMKGVIYSINPTATVVDITHHVPPQNVRLGAIVLAEASRWFPEGTIHVAVVDPGVGTDRAIVYAEAGRQHFIAPDNGLLTRVLARSAPARLVRLERPEYWLRAVSSTFHGRDIMAPVAARLSLGLDPGELGSAIEKLALLPWPEPVCAPGRIAGEVVEVDPFGNLITNIEREHLEQFAPLCDAAVHVGRHQVEAVVSTYGDRQAGELVALVGSSGLLEVAVVAGNAAERLQLGEGAEVIVERRDGRQIQGGGPGTFT